MVLGYLGSPHGSIPINDVADPATRRALQEIDTTLTELEHAILQAKIASPLALRSYLAADLPDATANTGSIVYVSDTGKFKGSTGGAWVDLN